MPVRKWKAYDGKSYTVSEQGFQNLSELQIAPAPGLLDTAAEAQQRVLDAARVREAHRQNLDATIRALAGRDPSKEFGADVEHDRIKFTDWSPDTCDCTVRFMWHRDHPEDGRVHHGHAALRVCAAHSDIAIDAKRHHEELIAENKHKNISRHALAEELGVDIAEVSHSYDGKRMLHLHHPKLDKPRAVPRKG